MDLKELRKALGIIDVGPTAEAAILVDFAAQRERPVFPTPA